MISNKLEKIIFIIISIILYVFFGYFATQIKADYLPINNNLTPEELIQAEFKGNYSEYKYFIKDSFLFACIKTDNGFNSYNIAFKNNRSGFMFNVPGTVIGSIYQVKYFYTVLNDDNKIISTQIRKYNSKYVISIRYDFQEEIEIFIDDKKLEPFSFEDSPNTLWGDVIYNINNDMKLYCVYQGQKYNIVDYNEIINKFGG